MKAFESSKDNIVVINAKLLFVFCLATISYLIWPPSVKWWGWGFLSICVAMTAVAVLVETLKQIFKLQDFKRDQEEFIARGKPVKSSTLASNSRMRNDGVIRDAN